MFNQTDRSVLLGYSKDQAKLEFEGIGKSFTVTSRVKYFANLAYPCSSDTEVNHAQAYGRIAFSVPHAEQPEIQKRIKESGNTIITDLITLDTPGKASVRVIILADPVSAFRAVSFQI